MTRQSLEDPRFYLNRHLQWLAFNHRVLEEARDPSNPLLERVKFLAITANNLDEFVEIRVSSFLQRIEHGSRDISPDGFTTGRRAGTGFAAMQQFVRDQYKCLERRAASATGKAKHPRSSLDELDAKAAQAAKNFYDRRVSPMLTPVTVDPSHPFPHVLNKALCIAFFLRRRSRNGNKPVFGVVTVPRALPRLLRLPAATEPFTTCFCRTSFLRTPKSYIADTRFWPPRRFASRGTAIFTWRKKKRERAGSDRLASGAAAKRVSSAAGDRSGRAGGNCGTPGFHVRTG